MFVVVVTIIRGNPLHLLSALLILIIAAGMAPVSSLGLLITQSAPEDTFFLSFKLFACKLNDNNPFV